MVDISKRSRCMHMIRPSAPKQLSTVCIVIPVYNEATGLPALLQRLDQCTSQRLCQWSFLFVNDASTDESLSVLQSLQAVDSRIGIISLSRQFGKEYAVSAGLAYAEGDAVVLMDADLQDPPECLPTMIDTWQSGYDVVAMRRSDRRTDSWFKQRSARVFYSLMQQLGDVEMPIDVGDFRLMSRRVVDVINQLPESNRCLKGLFAWAGFRTAQLDYKRAARHTGYTKWPVIRLLRLAIDGITAYSIAPLRAASVIGTAAAALAVMFGVFTLFKTLLVGDPARGFTTLLTVVTFIGGVQLMAIGVLGEYVGRTFMEVKRRPLFVVDSVSMPRPQSPAIKTVVEKENETV